MPLPPLDPARVAEVLSRFSARDQEIYRLIVLRRATVSEVAASAGLTEAAVRRTVLAVRAALSELGEEDQ